MSNSFQGSGCVGGSSKKVHSSKRKLNREFNSATNEDPQESEAPERNQKMPLVDDDFSPLSGIAFYSTVLKKVQFKPLYQMVSTPNIHNLFQVCIFFIHGNKGRKQRVVFCPFVMFQILPVRLHPYLPSKFAPATVTCRGKTWEMMFHGDSTLKRLDRASWRKFVEENDLKMGDAVFWEVMEDNKEKANLKVQIIKGDCPLESEANGSGSNPKDPITICKRFC
ncbi:OLC1v1001790C1 [Oldenlandia corymbosa var. corymbosa]|uniref:OLC1v1001790C1 n=1 Tax=Oldenlandia corymbosa var. corymbosa TaxID=529605 RepID=A0AAV1D6C2_OLDCO|nr:OLC1v1001790C1 [Oldenlandia corymbosa var. corymbosa]